jgi:Cthe_2314-like HEPN
METFTPIEYWSRFTNRSQFMLKLYSEAIPIFRRHTKQWQKDMGRRPLDSIGTDHERYLLSLVERISNLSAYFEDVFLTLTCLDVEKSKIALLYGESMTSEDYYKFHYDNFLIRMVTALDICAQLGNAIFGLRADEKYFYPHNFYQDPRVKDELAAGILKEFADYLHDIKQDRHRKVHQGASKENKFNNVLFWENIMKAIGKVPEEHDLVLEEYTQTQIGEVLLDIDEITRKSIEYVVGFMETCLPQLELILQTQQSN